MKHLLLAAVAAASIGIALPAAAQNLAIVNGKPIPKSRMDTVKAQLAKSGRPVSAEQEPQLRDILVTREILMQEAQRRGLDASDEYKEQVEMMRQDLLIKSLQLDVVKNTPVSDAEVQAEYDKFVASNGGKEYRARHILVPNEADAKAAIAEIKRGKKFEDVAKAKSKDPGSAANGGDLDWAPAANYVPEFSQALTKLAKGQMTQEPVKSSFGWHVIRVDDIREAQLPKMEELKPQIVQALQQQRLGKFQEDLKAKAKVE